ncbi:MAG: hypothetical protein ABR613_04485 [Actinomycetota bacterium]
MAKLDWADEQLTVLREKCRQFTEQPDLHDLIHDYDPKMGRYRIVARFYKTPPRFEWGLRAAEIAYHFRSALDQLVWQFVEHEGRLDPHDLRTQFPIYSDKDDFIEKVVNLATKDKGPLAGIDMNGPAWALIEGEQPCCAPDPSNHYLGSLHLLNNVDKHHMVHTTVGLATPDPTSKLLLHQPLRLIPLGGAVIVGGRETVSALFVANDAPLFDVQLAWPFPATAKMDVYGDLFVRVVFGEFLPSGDLKGVSVNQLRSISTDIRNLIRRAEPLLV